jgi:aspartate racemase
MTEARQLGLIGGLGPAATVHYYLKLVEAHQKRGRVPRLLIAHADYNKVLELVTAKNYDGLADYLADLVAAMAAGGAELTAIVAATPHICADRLAARSPLPLIDMLSAVAREVKSRGWRRVALLGTRFTVETKLFGRLAEVEVVTPSSDEISHMHNLYTSIGRDGATPAGLAELKALARTFISRDGAEAILVAATDLSPVMDENGGDFPMLDCASVHIEAITRALLD